MTDTVRPIREGVTLSADKQQMLDAVAEAYDLLASEGHGAPAAIVFAVVNERGGTQTGYFTTTAIDDRNTLHIARGITCLNTDLLRWAGKEHTCG